MDKPDYSKFHTKQLKKMLRESYNFRNDEWFEDKNMTTEDIKEELNKREHVLTSAQSKLIRQMSKKAGKKLNLQEAQLLNNKTIAE